MVQFHDESQAPARVPSRFEIVNALAWILARADDLLASGCDPQRAFDQALQEHEAMLVRNEKRTSARVYQAARAAWASIAMQDDARLLAWVLLRAADYLGDGREHHEAIEQATTDCQRTWERVTRIRITEAHQVACFGWAAASEGDPRVGAGTMVDALEKILERAAALHRGGCDPGDAIACALNEHKAGHALARVAFAAWGFTVDKSEAIASPTPRPNPHRRGRA